MPTKATIALLQEMVAAEQAPDSQPQQAPKNIESEISIPLNIVTEDNLAQSLKAPVFTFTTEKVLFLKVIEFATETLSYNETSHESSVAVILVKSKV